MAALMIVCISVADIPEKYQSEVLKDYLARMMATAGGEVKEKGAEVV